MMHSSLEPVPGDLADHDRTHFVPDHDGDNILPNAPLFSTLLRFAKRSPPRIAIRDVNIGIERTHAELLVDVLEFRHQIQKRLSTETLMRLRKRKEVYIAILAPGGYEYSVAFLAILALGAAAVPLSTHVPVEEAAYLLRKSRSIAIITASSAEKLGTSLEIHLKADGSAGFRSISISPHLGTSALSVQDLLISSNSALNENDAGVVIFTSGTTGPPKGVVMRRSFVYDYALSVADHYRLMESDVILHILPVHHATGVGINFFPFLVSGACIEFRNGSFDASWLWERWRAGGLSFFSGVPTIYMRMMRFYEENLASLPSHELDQYISGARNLRALLCGSSALPEPIQKFWTMTMAGRTILTRYGATEFGAPFKVSLEDKDLPDGSVGKLEIGLDVKLSDGEEGEILIKCPHMFARYISDDKATSEAHDSDGYFKTGDIARRSGPYYFILGRASLDIIKSGGYKISALDIERDILSLPYVSEVMVVGVDDEEYGQRVAAAISLRKDRAAKRSLSIEELRKDLRGLLTGYKLPTLLRVVDGELPKNVSGKILKKVLGAQLFPPDYCTIPEVQIWTRQLNVARL